LSPNPVSLAGLFDAVAAASPWEAAAVLLAIAYLALAIRQSRWCWPAAIASTAIYVVLMYRARLYLESALQVFYIGVAVYGWWCWARGDNQGEIEGSNGADGPGGGAMRVRTWQPRAHFLLVTGIVLLSALSAVLLKTYTAAALPLLDSFTTWGSIAATWMVARKLLENWLYWFVIDAVSVYIYLNRGLPLTAALFVLYLVMIVVGFRAWRKSMAGVRP
jgi:nicotinamide mononucleotide transporter